MNKDFIEIKGCRVHNLKNIDLNIPKNKLVVITGLSGSGKSSLAFDTLYAEGQRRYVESLSAYARQFLGVMDKPDVDKIEGISPAISIDQRKATHNPRSTVGTMTEIYDYLRLLFARIGKPHCPKCGKRVLRQTIDQIVNQIIKLPKNQEVTILGPVIRGRKGEHHGILEEIQKMGFVRVRINGILHRVEEALETMLDKNKKHNIEVVVDRLLLNKGLERARLVDSIETGLKMGKGIIIVNCASKNGKSEDLIFSEHFACEECEVSLPDLEPRLFSFNSPYGACPACTGLGEKLEVAPELVIPNPNLSLAEGAIFPWARASHKVGRQNYFWLQISNLAEKYDFPLNEPIKELPKKIIDIILYGGKEFEGVIPNLERKHRETDSDYTRQEIEQYMIKKECPVCKGKRLKPEALAVTIDGKSIHQIVEKSIIQNKDFFEKLPSKLTDEEIKIAKTIIKEILNRLQFLIDVGLDYLALDRKTGTLAGGEEQRVRLATQIGSKLTGILYILDEPSVGLHPRDQERLIRTLKQLRDLGNSVIVVEHDPQTIKEADWIIDIGPGAGKHGGKVTFEGTPKELLKSNTLTGEYLSGRKSVEFIKETKEQGIKNREQNVQQGKFLIIKGASEHNLKNIDVKIPLGKFVCVTGVSGSGKSSLVNDVLAKALFKKFYHPLRPKFSLENPEEDPIFSFEDNGISEPGKYKDILGIEHLNKAVIVDQSPIGRTPRSNPVTYTGTFVYIRDLFSNTKEARVRGYNSGRFSFNVKGGRCEACQGQGVKKIEMYFLPPVFVTCKECNGKRYNKEALEIGYKEKNIAEILEMTVEEALEFFKNIPQIYQKLKTLNEVGLGYVELGQPAPYLSGGEAQRVKLATELSKKATGKTLYILDEPTTGLHPDDIKKLLFVLRGLVNQGNTVLVIEHNLDVIKNADWIIDLGPEGGEKGGEVLGVGTPEKIAKNKKSYTGKYLSTQKR